MSDGYYSSKKTNDICEGICGQFAHRKCVQRWCNEKADITYEIGHQVWDLGGQERLRTSWATYYHGTHAVITVIDGTDRARISIMKDELFRLLGHEDLQHSVILIFANKQDLKDAMTPAEITDCLSLHSI